MDLHLTLKKVSSCLYKLSKIFLFVPPNDVSDDLKLSSFEMMIKYLEPNNFGLQINLPSISGVMANSI